MAQNYLIHWGRKGQKWGVRRYQNKDGTLTEAGKRRYYKEADSAGYRQETAAGARYKTTKKNKHERFNADPDKWANDDLRKNSEIASEASNLARKSKDAVEVVAKHRPPPKKMDLSKMSDKEMRDQINRAMLEKQYNDIFNPQKQSKGHEYVVKTLEIGGAILAAGSTAIGLAMKIREFKKGT